SGSTGNSFQASFVDATTGGINYNDFYRTVVHEIGHAMGLFLGGPVLDSFTTNAGTDQVNHTSALKQFHNASGQFGVNATFTTFNGGHIYEGPVDPIFPTAPTHPNDLLNDGRTVPPPGGNPIPTTRQFISDLDAQILADAYGYTVTLPSALNTAHATLDS